MKAKLILDTGHTFLGEHLGYPKSSSGELVFTTSMVGYSESLTDPSYCGQILSFSYPMVGNYGCRLHKEIGFPLPSQESHKIHAKGAVVSESCESPSHRESDATLSEFLIQNKVPGVSGIDTRHLTQIIRENHKVLGKIIIEKDFNKEEALSFYDPNTENLLPLVSNDEITIIGDGKKIINFLNFGVKWNIVRAVLNLGYSVKLHPWDYRIQENDIKPWVLSNGPGNPFFYHKILPEVRKLIEKRVPTLGICLGSQLIAMAADFNIVRLPFGHRSHNQSVIDNISSKGYITSQNHSYVVEDVQPPWQLWFTNINDNTVEGFKSSCNRIQAVQFHPEAAAGPNDTLFIINSFLKTYGENI